MFEKCGLMDVLYHIWRHKWLMLIICAVALGLGFCLGMVKGEASPSDALLKNRTEWVSSASFFVHGTDDSVGQNETTLSRDQQMAYGILAIVNADYKRAEIFQALSEKYTAEQITEGLALDVAPEQVSFYSLQPVVNGSVPTGTSILHLYLVGKNKQIVSDYADLLRNAVEETAAEMGNCEVKYIDGVVGEKAEETVNDISTDLSPVSQGILFAIVGFVLAVLAVAVKAIFWPTVNRRSDFAAYDLPVLGEVRIRK